MEQTTFDTKSEKMLKDISEGRFPKEAVMSHLMCDISRLGALSLSERDETLAAIGIQAFEEYMAFAAKAILAADGNLQGLVERYNAERGSLPEMSTEGWFSAIDQHKERLSVQFGCHLEEVREMFPEITSDSEDLNAKMQLVDTLLGEVADAFKSGAKLTVTNHKKFFDSLVDQRVTLTGTAIFSGYNLKEGVARVDWSNFTKFINGYPQYKLGSGLTKVGKGKYWWEAPMDGLTGE